MLPMNSQNITDTFIAIENAAHEGAFGINSRPTPTQSQCLAGNYKVGKTVIYGLPVSIEQPRHSYRTGVDEDGKEWSSRLAAHYGYFSGTKGADGDPVDCFIGVYPQSEYVWVINQRVAGSFDEHKVMLCFPDEESARTAYLQSYDRGWNGLHSIVKASISQFKWWLKNGNHKRPLLPAYLPYDGLETMNQKIAWDSAQNPENMSIDKVLYEIRRADAGENLVFDAVTMADILERADEIAMFDALISPYSKLQRKMELLQAVMDRAGGAIKPVAMQLSEPFKQNGVAQVAAVFELSDGQTISIFFHNPDITPAKIAPTDELISWKWLLNKKDITIVVAPEKGQDLNVKAVAQRIIKLAEKNSASFQKANTKRAENLAAIEALKTEIPVLEKELSDAQKELELVKFEADNQAVNDVEAQRKASDELAQQILQSLIDDYGWQNQSQTSGPLFWVTKTIGGGREGGVVNPNGDRRVSAKVQGGKLVAMWGDAALVSVDLVAGDSAKDNAGRLDAAVNAEDPRYVAPDNAGQNEIDPTTPEGYAQIKGIGNMELRYQDVLDDLFTNRVSDVLDALKGYGWKIAPGPAYEKSGNKLTYESNYVGAGNNVVGITWKVNDGDDLVYPDNLESSVSEIAMEINSVAPRPGVKLASDELPQGEDPNEPDLTQDESYDREDVAEVNKKQLVKFVMKNRFESDKYPFSDFLDQFNDESEIDSIEIYELREFATTAFLVKKAVADYGGIVLFGNFNSSAYSADIFDSATLDKANQAAKAVVGGIVGQIANAAGEIVARIRIEESGMLTVYKGASGLERIASPTMAVSRINGAISALFGGEENMLKEPNLSKPEFPIAPEGWGIAWDKNAGWVTYQSQSTDVKINYYMRSSETNPGAFSIKGTFPSGYKFEISPSDGYAGDRIGFVSWERIFNQANDLVDAVMVESMAKTGSSETGSSPSKSEVIIAIADGIGGMIRLMGEEYGMQLRLESGAVKQLSVAPVGSDEIWIGTRFYAATNPGDGELVDQKYFSYDQVDEAIEYGKSLVSWVSGNDTNTLKYSDKVQFSGTPMRGTFGDKQACFVEWKSGKNAVFGALVGASDYDKKEFGLGVFRQGKGEFAGESIVKIDPVAMKISFVDNTNYMATDEVKWIDKTTLTKLVIFNKALFEKAFDPLTDAELAALEPVVERDPNDMRGMAFAIEKDGKLFMSGSVPKLSDKSEQTDISYYKKMTDQVGGNLYVGGISVDMEPVDTSDLILGMTWRELQARQHKESTPDAVKSKMPKDAALVYSAQTETDPAKPNIDTLQSIVDGGSDGEDLNALLDKIDAAARALIDAGLGEQYDDLIGKAAEKWAELDQKANG